MNPFDNQPDHDPADDPADIPADDEAFDLDDLLDDAFAARQVPVLSPSLMDVRRRARRRRNRTRAVGLAAAACVSVGGVAVLLNSHRPAPRSAVGTGEFGGEQPCVPQTTVLVTYPPTLVTYPPTTPPANSSSAPPLTYPPVTPPDNSSSVPPGAVFDTTTLPPMTTLSPSTIALPAGLIGATTTTDSGVVTPSTTCLPQPPSGFRCIGDPTATEDGWTYYDYCETVGGAVPPSYEFPTAPPTTAPVGESGVYTVVFGDYLFDIAKRFCTTADLLVEYNGWPEGMDHPLNPGDLVQIPPSASANYCGEPYPTTTTDLAGGSVGEPVDPSSVSTTELPATTTTVGP